MKRSLILVLLLTGASFIEAPAPKRIKQAPVRKWTELVVRCESVERCRQLARRLTDSPTKELKVYDQGTVQPSTNTADEFVLPFTNLTNSLCQIETTPRGLSPIGQLDLLSLVPEERCEDAWINFVFHSYSQPNRFEHWEDLHCCAAWSE